MRRAQVPDQYSSAAAIKSYNNVDRPAGAPMVQLPKLQQPHLNLTPPLPPPSQKSYVSPNPVADFFCAPTHTTLWPHNEGYRR